MVQIVKHPASGTPRSVLPTGQQITIHGDRFLTARSSQNQRTLAGYLPFGWLTVVVMQTLYLTLTSLGGPAHTSSEHDIFISATLNMTSDFCPGYTNCSDPYT